MKTGKGLAEHAKSLIGTPYFYGSKLTVLTPSFMQSMANMYPNIVTKSYINYAIVHNQVGVLNVDCSGVIGSYRKKQIGSSQLLSTAKKRLPIKDIDKFAIGTVLWKQGHVGVYVGNGNCVEAKGIKYGTILSRVSATNWVYGLTFDDMSYEYDEKVIGTSKNNNPYKEPTRTLHKGHKGDDVKWLQFELNEAGSNLKVDGDFGDLTFKAVIAFQSSCKIVCDGIVGPETRKNLLN